MQDSERGGEQISDKDSGSIMSSDYTHRYGRRRSAYHQSLLMIRYHGMSDNPYPLPNDELEKDRLDALQRSFHLLLGKNIVAPIVENPTQISDSTVHYSF